MAGSGGKGSEVIPTDWPHGVTWHLQLPVLNYGRRNVEIPEKRKNEITLPKRQGVAYRIDS